MHFRAALASLRHLGCWGLLIGLAGTSGCSHLALNYVADVLAAPGHSYARDDDPELVRASIPVILKTMEQVPEGVPQHRALIEALVRTCTAFGAGFIEEDADRLQESNVAGAQVVYLRARRMFLRARGYGLDGLDLAVPGLPAALLGKDAAARDALLAKTAKKDVGLLYWTGAAWASAISVSRNDLALVGQLPVAEAIMRRALLLDESFDEGSLHEFFLVVDAGRPVSEGGGIDKARAHYQRALALDHGKKLGPLVSWAETVDVATQNKAEFKQLLDKVEAADVLDADLDHRLVNILAQRRAHWLLSRMDDLFAE